jgi:hypothetical protein
MSNSKDTEQEKINLIEHGEDNFWKTHVLLNSYIKNNLNLFILYLNSSIDRQEAAEQEGIKIGELLKIFNKTAPVLNPIKYSYQKIDIDYVIRPMNGLCDDYYGDRYGKFGNPVTLRIYLTEKCGLPAKFFELADWNFMDADLPYFVGYSYGSQYDNILFLSGIQSDIAQRYTYLFLAKGEGTQVRENDEIQFRDTDDLKEKYGILVPRFRKIFQRNWIDIMFAGILSYMIVNKLEAVAIHQFPLIEEENQSIHLVNRIYRGIKRKLRGQDLVISTKEHEYLYYKIEVKELYNYLKKQWNLEQINS